MFFLGTGIATHQQDIQPGDLSEELRLSDVFQLVVAHIHIRQSGDGGERTQRGYFIASHIERAQVGQIGQTTQGLNAIVGQVQLCDGQVVQTFYDTNGIVGEVQCLQIQKLDEYIAQQSNEIYLQVFQSLKTFDTSNEVVSQQQTLEKLVSMNISDFINDILGQIEKGKHRTSGQVTTLPSMFFITMRRIKVNTSSQLILTEKTS